MSLFYFTSKIISKANQSAVASASYRSGQKLYSERDEEFKSYRKREVEPDSFILAPEHAPEWVYNRETLWNEVEKIERNWNSQLSREVLVALPRELSNDVQKELLTEFVKGNFTDEGMVADVSIHRDKKENPHAHIMLTIRPFNEDGTWGKKRVKNEEGKWIHSTNWNDKETLIQWRKNFAEKVNEYYKKHEINERVSHESYEKQGLDKLPKQRLTRKEYQVEQKLKEEALKNGEEYKPKTYYAKQNLEIEKANQEIERLTKQIEFATQKVVSLSDYREYRNEEEIDKLNQIRKSAKLSPDDWKSLKIISNRMGGFIDYNKAKENLDKLDNWKKKLDFNTNLLVAENKVLIKARNIFETEPKKTLFYGFIPSKFHEEFARKVNELKERKQNNDKALKAFDELYQHSNRVYEIQKEFIKEEFNYLYPEYQNKFDDNDKVIELKSKYVDLFRKEGYKRENLPEFENENYKLDSSYVKLESLVKDWKETNHSLLVLERTKEKRKAEYNENYQNYKAKEIYNSSVKYANVREQIDIKEAHKDTLKIEIINSLVARYPAISIETIKEIPANMQVKLLELHLKNEHTGKLSEDLKTVKEQIFKKSNEYNKNELDNTTSQLANDSSMVVDNLIDIAKTQETKDHDLEAKRQQKKKPKKLLQREMEREM